jgi:hypothetical protein
MYTCYWLTRWGLLTLNAVCQTVIISTFSSSTHIHTSHWLMYTPITWLVPYYSFGEWSVCLLFWDVQHAVLWWINAHIFTQTRNTRVLDMSRNMLYRTAISSFHPLEHVFFCLCSTTIREFSAIFLNGYSLSTARVRYRKCCTQCLHPPLNIWHLNRYFISSLPNMFRHFLRPVQGFSFITVGQNMVWKT